ncbi:hypothetical protein GGX14DRAFT_405111 [Mycena pura]|uniref:Endonuclease/exonuclease/phosphatase domain-containing protein n=1 Tax=Mycena pura TaxID=153505 RepID=A0AAD6USZ8_9AGAR|nr:hypothetical protein GGX14DRAFT_405111 [Mycena pura]
MVLRIGDLYVVNAYILPVNARSMRKYHLWQDLTPWATFKNLVHELITTGVQFTIHGDLNARVGPYAPNLPWHSPCIADDIACNARGTELLDLCQRYGLFLVNGSIDIPGTHSGMTYFHRRNPDFHGEQSTVDYTIASYSARRRVQCMDILPRDFISNHEAVQTVLRVQRTMAASALPVQMHLQRSDLQAPRETEFDEWMQEMLADAMDEDDLASFTYGTSFPSISRTKQVYVDGSCLRQASTHAASGAGIFWGPNNPANKGVRVPGRL